MAAVIYLEISGKKLKQARKISKKGLLSLIFLNLTLTFIFIGNFFILELNSFYSSVAALVPLILFIWFKRRDLILDSVCSGVLLIAVGWIGFWIPEFITPEWVNTQWFLHNLSGIIILKAPLEDGIWGFLVGAYIGPLYEFVTHAKITAIK